MLHSQSSRYFLVCLQHLTLVDPIFFAWPEHRHCCAVQAETGTTLPKACPLPAQSAPSTSPIGQDLNASSNDAGASEVAVGDAVGSSKRAYSAKAGADDQMQLPQAPERDPQIETPADVQVHLQTSRPLDAVLVQMQTVLREARSLCDKSAFGEQSFVAAHSPAMGDVRQAASAGGDGADLLKARALEGAQADCQACAAEGVCHFM